MAFIMNVDESSSQTTSSSSGESLDEFNSNVLHEDVILCDQLEPRRDPVDVRGEQADTEGEENMSMDVEEYSDRMSLMQLFVNHPDL